MNELRLTAPEPLDHAVNLLDLTSRACDTFTQPPPEEQRRPLTTILEQGTWKEGTLTVTLLEPFRHSAPPAPPAPTKGNTNGTTGRDILAPRHGFEPRFTAPKAAVLPLDDRGSAER